MRFILIVISLMMSSVSFAQPSSADVYGKLPSKSLMRISPNGQFIAYRDVNDGRDLMLVTDLVAKKIIAAVDVSKVKPTNAYFLGNNKLIMVASSNTRLGGYVGRHNVSIAYAYNFESKKLVQLLTPGKGIHLGQTDVGRIVGVSNDNKYTYMTAYRDAGSFNLFRVNTDRKGNPLTHKRGTSDTIDFFVGKNGKVLARERYHQKDNLHRIDALIDDKWVEIFKEEVEIRTKGFDGITPDEKSLVMKISVDGRWAYHTMSLTDGKISAPLFSHADKDVESFITDINRVVHGVRYSGFKPTYDFFDETLNARMRGLAVALPNNTFTIYDYTPDWKSMVFYLDGEASSGDYLMYHGGSIELIAPARPEIARNNIHPINEYTFKARDGLTIPSLITVPVNKEAKNLPAIMLPHGGPAAYDKIAFDWLTQYFANEGYVVIQPQFRGSKGFGFQHLQRGRGEWGKKMQDDLTDAVADLANKGIIDKSRVCIVGASYGGYAALAGAAFTPDLYKCAVSINGVSDINRMLRSDRKDYGRHHWVVSYWDKVIKNGKFDSDYLDTISPINFAKQIKAPVLLIHGERDKVVKPVQSEIMEDALEDADKAVTFLELNKGDHNLSSEKNRIKALNEIGKFVKKHI